MNTHRRITRVPAEAENSIGGAPSATQARGQLAENLAAHHLETKGVRIIARNVHCRGGEVDLIGLHGNSVVFVEVRLRTNKRFGGAAESITITKQRRVLLAARCWLNGAGRRFQAAACRFDAVLLDALDDAQLTWLRGAFDAD